ncbi:MAG: hypothetical protein E6Q59_05525 [Nitrosomonas sp.]|uniref:hypothetical protein n=1 Tax=unclassified Nitrosomonas TaxID=2609265 RepID=UPI000A0AF5BE|nr:MULTISPECIES: hypothetical protein [unclassified Nitrosomonas]MBX9916711.1 hypothetical protein [Nitrosomonas sp.]OQW80898.1 MAG: hypothetical protein BVN30_12360 [Proteobacteria bacterium ST_bin16]MDV6341764.1 hypothetical protein [Nitrosomonas sp. Is24]MDV6346993.1 hypothetical protein [Nitrosomonas sp. Is35]TXI39040.1 MAG: hypothetical protein E6Q59_05525 [Nitrosomonas sp.]
MHKLLPSVFLFLILALPFSVFAHEGEDHSHDESASELDGGNGWRLVRKVELGTSGKFVNLVLIDHAVYTDKTIYSAVINRLCSPSDQFCRIRFWSEERFVPETAALTVEQNKQLRADYLVNKTAGMHHLRWSCTVDPDKTHCF